MISLSRAVAAVCSALMLVAVAPARAETPTDPKRSEFERIDRKSVV